MVELNRYQEINNSFRRKLVFHLGYEAGFYSEFNNMVLAMIYCLENRVRFSLYSEDANFKFEQGWTDFFLPFCEEVADECHHKYNVRFEDPFFTLHKLERIKYLLWRLKNKRTYLTSDVFFKFRTADFERKCFQIPELDIKGNLRQVAREIVNMIYRFNEVTAEEIHKNVTNLCLPDSYIGLHIRGGDKFVEHELEQCAVYMEKAEGLTSLRTAFVLTDDYTIMEALRRDYPAWTFYTLATVEERGYFHHEFQKQSAVERREALIKLFSSVEILRKSKLFIGTFSSNPGMFLGMCMEEAYGVDYDRWMLW